MKWLIGMLAVLAMVVVESVSAGTVTYVYTDPQGTTLAEADASGNIIATYDYRPYGSRAMGMAPNGPGYTGHVNDQDTGLVYMQARYYDPEVGRFLSVDVIKVKPGDIYSVSMYMYVHASPAMLLDPAGKQAKKGVDMEICNGTVPCDVNVSFGATLVPSDESPDKQVDRTFANYTYIGGGEASPGGMPEELRTALVYILGSPLGRPLMSEVSRVGRKVGLMEIPSGRRPDFRYDAGSGLIFYTLDLASYKAQFMNTPVFSEVKDQTLDVILMHEIGHTSQGRVAFGVKAMPATQQDEFEDVRKVENPYRSFYGIPARTSYNGISLP